MRTELASYSIHDLLQEVAARPEFWGILIYANRAPFDTESAPDDRLFTLYPQAFPKLGVIRTLARDREYCRVMNCGNFSPVRYVENARDWAWRISLSVQIDR